MEETGMEPEVKNYFRKIINSFAFGLLWLLTVFTAGLYFRLAYIEGSLRWFNTAFYAFLLLSFAGLLFYYYKQWKG